MVQRLVRTAFDLSVNIGLQINDRFELPAGSILVVIGDADDRNNQMLLVETLEGTRFNISELLIDNISALDALGIIDEQH